MSLIANGQPYNGTQSIFLRTLIGKKYALPYEVIDEIVSCCLYNKYTYKFAVNFS